MGLIDDFKQAWKKAQEPRTINMEHLKALCKQGHCMASPGSDLDKSMITLAKDGLATYTQGHYSNEYRPTAKAYRLVKENNRTL